MISQAYYRQKFICRIQSEMGGCLTLSSYTLEAINSSFFAACFCNFFRFFLFEMVSHGAYVKEIWSRRKKNKEKHTDTTKKPNHEYSFGKTQAPREYERQENREYVFFILDAAVQSEKLHFYAILCCVFFLFSLSLSAATLGSNGNERKSSCVRIHLRGEMLFTLKSENSQKKTFFFSSHLYHGLAFFLLKPTCVCVCVFLYVLLLLCIVEDYVEWIAG